MPWYICLFWIITRAQIISVFSLPTQSTQAVSSGKNRKTNNFKFRKQPNWEFKVSIMKIPLFFYPCSPDPPKLAGVICGTKDIICDLLGVCCAEVGQLVPSPVHICNILLWEKCVHVPLCPQGGINEPSLHKSIGPPVKPLSLQQTNHNFHHKNKKA